MSGHEKIAHISQSVYCDLHVANFNLFLCGDRISECRIATVNIALV